MPYNEDEKEQYLPNDKERDFIEKVWQDFNDLYQLKTEPLDILGGGTLQSFWDRSNYDYNVLTEQGDENDPVVQYSSGISRDQSDVFIGQLVNQLVYPSVVAQNQDQKIDRIMGKVGRAILEWLYNNDGYPSESGHQKLVRAIQKKVIEGTVHILDTITKDGLESELAPNEELFIPNFWQPDIQKQGQVMRVKLNVTYDEVESMFGDRPNWKYVHPFRYDSFFVERPEFKDSFEGILDDDYMQVLYVYRRASKKELDILKEKGKVKSNCKRACFYNVVINDVPMYDIDNILPYNDGYYPISKGIFAFFSKPEFYWGNSLPNKIKEDKGYLDAWKTLLRYKAKLNILKPLISKNGELIDEEIVMPAKITPIPDGVEVQTIDGIGEPVNQSDMLMVQMAEKEIERGSKAPQTQIDPDTKARSAVIMEANAKVLLNNFALQIIFLLSARTYLIMTRAFEKLPRNIIKKIAVPDQMLNDGKIGTLEVIFERLPKKDMKEMGKDALFEYLDMSKKLRDEEKMSAKNGDPKNIIKVDPEYARTLNLYIKFEAGTNAFGKDELQKAQFNRNVQLYLSRPDLFNTKKVARKFVQYNKDDEDLINDQAQPMQIPQQVPQGAGSQLEAGQVGQMGNLPKI